MLTILPPVTRFLRKNLLVVTDMTKPNTANLSVPVWSLSEAPLHSLPRTQLPLVPSAGSRHFLSRGASHGASRAEPAKLGQGGTRVRSHRRSLQTAVLPTPGEQPVNSMSGSTFTQAGRASDGGATRTREGRLLTRDDPEGKLRSPSGQVRNQVLPRRLPGQSVVHVLWTGTRTAPGLWDSVTPSHFYLH